MQKEELRRSKDRVQEEEKNSRSAHQELATIRKTLNRVKECITLLKGGQLLPLKKEVGKKVLIMASDLEKLEAEVAEAEAMRDSTMSMSDHEKQRLDQLIREAKTENKMLRRELETRDRVISNNSRLFEEI